MKSDPILEMKVFWGSFFFITYLLGKKVADCKCWLRKFLGSLREEMIVKGLGI